MHTSFFAVYSKFLVIFLAVLSFVACKDNNSEPIIDPVEDNGFLSVVNVSTQTSLPPEIVFDGVNRFNLALARQTSKYELIAAGTRKFSLGNYEDTIRIQEHNYYTLMVFDKDSVQITHDASPGNGQFNQMPMVRWTLVGANPSDYRVHMFGDSLIRNIPVNEFIYFSTTAVQLQLFHKARPDNQLAKGDFPVEMNKKVTVNIQYDPAKKEYTFHPIMQTVGN